MHIHEVCNQKEESDIVVDEESKDCSENVTLPLNDKTPEFAEGDTPVLISGTPKNNTGKSPIQPIYYNNCVLSDKEDNDIENIENEERIDDDEKEEGGFKDLDVGSEDEDELVEVTIQKVSDEDFDNTIVGNSLEKEMVEAENLDGSSADACVLEDHHKHPMEHCSEERINLGNDSCQVNTPSAPVSYLVPKRRGRPYKDKDKKGSSSNTHAHILGMMKKPRKHGK